jgi:hypothetical protein
MSTSPSLTPEQYREFRRRKIWVLALIGCLIWPLVRAIGKDTIENPVLYFLFDWSPAVVAYLFADFTVRCWCGGSTTRNRLPMSETDQKSEQDGIWICLVLALLAWPLIYGVCALWVRFGLPPLLGKVTVSMIKLCAVISCCVPFESRLLTLRQILLVVSGFLVIWAMVGRMLFHWFGNPLHAL